MKNSKILITGGSGFIGSNLVRRLLSDEVEIHVVTKPDSDLWRLKGILDKVHIHPIRLEDFSALQNLIHQISPKVIFHLAAFGVSSSDKDHFQMASANITGTLNLLMASRDLDYEGFIQMGGSSEYGNKHLPMNEQDVLEPTTFYGATKACSTLLARQFAHEFRKPLAILRAFSVYGYYESPSRLIPTAINAALQGKPLKLTPKGLSRDYVFVEDVVEALYRTWEKRIYGEIINVGTGIQTANEGVIEQIEGLLGKKIALTFDTHPPRLSDKPFWVADTYKLQQLLNWKPAHSFKEGLEKTITFMSNG